MSTETLSPARSSVKLATVCVAALLSCCASVLGQQTPPSAAKGKASASTAPKSVKVTPELTAQSMVKAVNDYDHGHPFTALTVEISEQETEATKRFFAKAQTAAEENLSGKAAMDVIFAGRAYYVYVSGRRSLTREQIAQRIAEYEARFDKIDKTTIDAFHPDTGSAAGTRTLVVLGIAYHSFLWEGRDWKQGNPQRALARLKTLSTDAVSHWKQAAKDGGIADPEFAPWSLLAIDSLFVNDAFQEQVFKNAFPIAEKLLRAK